MIFKRRHRPGFGDRVRSLLAPRKGWRRGFRYIGRRVQRLPDSPHRIALGFACGALASFTPFFTLHIVVAVGMAAALRGNLIAAAFGTVVGNPITFPLIAWTALSCGGWLTGHHNAADSFDASIVFRDFSHFIKNLFAPYLIGGIGPGLITAVISYYLLRPAVGAYQNRRRMKLMTSAKARVEAHLKRGKIKTGAPVVDPAE